MTDRDTCTVSFAVARRDTGFWFRKATNSTYVWHGPYPDTETVAEMLCFYTREDLLEQFESLPEPLP
jgi:hypothetical protein